METGNLNGMRNLAQNPIPATYPKGFGSFSCMKYEVTEGQYVDSLDRGIAGPFSPDQENNWRHTIKESEGSDYETSAPDRACGYIADVNRTLTFLDWSGLRPMSELEFENACRGPKKPWVNEDPWEKTTFVSISGFDGVDGSGRATTLP